MNRKTIKLYQTLADKNNSEEVEKHGPYKCTNKARAWLGIGYYFWDTFIELAHWWGNFGYNGSYIICESVRNDDENLIFDLYANFDHINDFREYWKMLQNTGMYTVSGVLEHLKKHTDFCNKFIAVRVRGEHNTSSIPSYLNLVPPVQICYFNCPDIQSWNFKVVYPEDYVDIDSMEF